MSLFDGDSEGPRATRDIRPVGVVTETLTCSIGTADDIGCVRHARWLAHVDGRLCVARRREGIDGGSIGARIGGANIAR